MFDPEKPLRKKRKGVFDLKNKVFEKKEAKEKEGEFFARNC
jgi:hypothetical protein